MAARLGGYYRAAFNGERGVTQGDPLSPTIFNVVVDAVVRHWLEGLQAAKEEMGTEGGGGTFLGGILRGRRNGWRNGPQMAPGRFQRPGSHLRQGRPED